MNKVVPNFRRINDRTLYSPMQNSRSLMLIVLLNSKITIKITVSPTRETLSVTATPFIALLSAIIVFP